MLEEGWQKRGSGSAFRRNVEIWRYAARCVFKVLAVNKAAKKGTKTEEEVSTMKVQAAEFIRDGLLKLGPTFVKLGQVGWLWCRCICSVGVPVVLRPVRPFWHHLFVSPAAWGHGAEGTRLKTGVYEQVVAKGGS